jgi:hypothetical protein
MVTTVVLDDVVFLLVVILATKMYISFSIEVSGTEFYLTKLHHFTQYEVNVQACREKSKEREDTSSPCSNTSSKFHRTMQKKGADDIKHVQVTNQSMEMVSITWKEPEDPNGVILCYTIEYKKLDNENVTVLVVLYCFSYLLF